MSGRVLSPTRGGRSKSPSEDSSISRGSSRSNGSKEKSQKKKADIDGSSRAREKDGKKKTEEARVSAEGTIFDTLPKLKDTPPDEQGELFQRKLLECCTVHNWRMSEAQLSEKEGKRQTLVELLELINERKPSLWLDEDVLEATFNMIGMNLFRTLTKRERLLADMADADEEDPGFDPAWPHLELVYEMLQRIVTCRELSLAYLSRFVTQPWIAKMVELTDSDDPRERECLKAFLLRIQNKMTTMRSALRRGLQQQLQLALVDGAVQNGLPEMLEIYGRFVHSFSAPIKEEHREVFRRLILPLHKVEWLAVFHSPLLDVIKKFCEKDNRLSLDVVNALLRFWPIRVSQKQILFLSELDDMISIMPAGELKQMQPQLGKVMVDCLTCINSDVADKCLFLWKSEKFMKVMFSQCKDLLPGIISALYDNATQHWQQSVHVRTVEVLKMMLEKDPELFDSSSAKHRKACEEKEKQALLREKRWAMLEAMHEKKLASPETEVAAQDVSPRSGADPSPRGRASTVGNTNVATKSASDGHRQSGDSSRGHMRRLSRVNSPRSTLVNGLGLTQDRYGFAVSWEGSGKPTGVVLQAAVLDFRGRILDALHERNPVSSDAGSLVLREEDVLSLDGMHQERSGTLWVQLSRLPSTTAAVVFVACARRGKMQDLDILDLHVVEDKVSTGVRETAAHFTTDQPVGASLALSVLRRGSKGQWSVARCCESSKSGRHVVDMVEPVLGKIIRELVSGLPKRHKSLYTVSSLARGGLVCMPSPSSLKTLFVGMSWDLSPPSSSGLDCETGKEGLLVAAVFFDCVGQALGASEVDGGGEELGARHGGKGLLGQGCMIDFAAVPEDAQQIFVVGFAPPEQPYVLEVLQKLHCCVVDHLGVELLRYRLPKEAESGETPCGWIAGRFIRCEDEVAANETSPRWSFQALGLPCTGISWESSITQIQQVFNEPPSNYQQLPPEVPVAPVACLVSL